MIINHRLRRATLIAASILLVSASNALAPSLARADSNHGAAQFASTTGNVIYLAAAVGLPFLRDHRQGMVHALRAADSIGTSTLVAEGLEYITHEQRPDHSNHMSFPSAHATAAFAAATAESAYHPGEALYWYLGAAAIGQSRVTLDRHHEWDVIVGAGLGYGMTRLELSAPHGLILAPLIEPAQHAAGISLTMPLK